MTQLERQIRSTQHRLWINRWFRGLSTSLTITAFLFAVVVLVQRAFELPIPLLPVCGGLCVIVLVVSAAWTYAKREGAAVAATTLDEAAGLRERLSSAHYCATEDDCFAQAVVTDAERVSGSLSARQHIRLAIPSSLGWATVTMVFAALMLLLPVGFLSTTEASEDREEQVQVRQARVAVKRQMDQVQKIIQETPGLEDMKDKLDGADERAGGKLQRPGDIRHEALKKIDKLADAVKQKRKSGKYDSVQAMRKMLRGLKVPKSPEAPTQKLTKALAKGDFQTAKEEIETLKEQLATLKSEKDEELAAQMSKQLDDLAKQLEKLAKNEELAKKLAEAGLKKEDIQRMLENLKKEDLDQLKKALEKKGLSQQQIEKIAKQLKQNQQAGSVAKKLSQAMKQGAKCNKAGQMGEAMAGLSVAGTQLSDLEQLEQEMNQLDSAMAGLENSSSNLNKPCKRCKGAG